MPSKRKWLERWEKEKCHGRPAPSTKSVNPEANILVKFCKPEHNIIESNCPTIHVGTLQYFREMEKSSPIADEQEGIERAIVDDNDAGHPSRKNIMEYLGFSVDGLSHIEIKNCTIITSTNCYIWCCSRLPKTVTKKQIAQFGVDQFGDENTSCYSLTDPKNFGSYLCWLLWESLSTSNFTNLPNDIPPGIPIRTMRGKITIHCYNSDVIYVPKKTLIIQDGQVQSPYIANIPKDLKLIFVKQDRFKENKESIFQSVNESELRGKSECVSRCSESVHESS